MPADAGALAAGGALPLEQPVSAAKASAAAEAAAREGTRIIDGILGKGVLS